MKKRLHIVLVPGTLGIKSFWRRIGRDRHFRENRQIRRFRYTLAVHARGFRLSGDFGEDSQGEVAPARTGGHAYSFSDRTLVPKNSV